MLITGKILILFNIQEIKHTSLSNKIFFKLRFLLIIPFSFKYTNALSI